jgi:hypothetical protein
MQFIPAFCDKCGTAFPSGFSVENAKHLTLSGNKVGPCPRCGGMGSVPDGVFNIVDGAIEVLLAPTITIERLGRLALLIQDARAKNMTAQQIGEQIAEDAPELSGLTELLPRTRRELYQFLAVLTAALSLVLHTKCSPQKTPIQLNTIVNESIEQTNGLSPMDVDNILQRVLEETKDKNSHERASEQNE